MLAAMDFEFSAEVIHWQGPAPFYFVAVPASDAARIAEVAPAVTYGWGVIPVRVTIGGTTFTTSLFPKDGGYLVPLKAAVRKAERLELGQVAGLRLEIAV